MGAALAEILERNDCGKDRALIDSDDLERLKLMAGMGGRAMTLDFAAPGSVLCACLIITGCSLQRQTSFKRGRVKASKLHNSGDLDFMAEKA